MVSINYLYSIVRIVSIILIYYGHGNTFMIYSFSIGKKKQTDSVKRLREGNKSVVVCRIRRSCVH